LMGWGFCLYLEFLNMCRLILNKKKYSGLWNWNLPSFTEECFKENKTSEKGCYSLIIHKYFLVVGY
jgi:hypothetical protein